MEIVSELCKRSEGKITLDEATALFSNEVLIHDRLTDLVAHGYLGYDGRRYAILSKGVFIARVIKNYRHLLGRDVGG